MNSIVIHFKNSIATRLLTVVFSLYFLVTLSVTILHMVAEYHNAKSSVQRDLESSQRIFEPGFADAIWNVNREGLRATLKGALQIPAILGVKIVDEKGRFILAEGEALDDSGSHFIFDAQNTPQVLESSGHLRQLFSHTFEVHYTREGKSYHVGQATFYSNNDIVLSKVKYGFLLIIINALIKTAALWAIFLGCSRSILSIPLRRLATTTQQVRLGLKDSDGQLKPYSPDQIYETHEIGLLAQAFDSMLKKLQQSKARLISIRMFARQIGHLPDSRQILRFAFDELLQHLPLTSAVLFLPSRDGRLAEVYPAPVGAGALEALPSEDQFQIIFGESDCDWASFEDFNPESPLGKCYQEPAPLAGGHLLYVRIRDWHQPHLLVFFRKVQQIPFDSNDLEYIESMIAEVRVIQQNVATILKTGRMEEEIKQARESLASLNQERQQMQHELDAAKLQLIQAEKLSTLGQMVAGIAHEISNPVNYISGSAHNLQREFKQFQQFLNSLVQDDPQAQEIKQYFDMTFGKVYGMVGDLQKGVQKVTEINHALRNYSRSDLQPQVGLQLREILEECLVILHARLRNHHLETIAQSQNILTGHRSQLGQVITNLLVNASDALDEKRAAMHSPPNSFQGKILLSLNDEMREGRAGVCLTVEDNGLGVPIANRTKIFEAFYTTKPVNKGTGLGLAVSLKIIQRHRGQLTISDSARLGGACFQIWLPVLNREEFDLPPDSVEPQKTIVPFSKHQSLSDDEQ